jgi:hypothetical protein
MKETIALLGTGKMGTALARAFAAAGHSVVAWNRTPARAEPLRAVATLASTPAAAARDASLLVASLTDYGVSDQVLFTAEMGELLWGRQLYSLRAGRIQTPAPALPGRCSTVCTISTVLSSRNQISSRPIMRPFSTPATGLCSMHTKQPLKRRQTTLYSLRTQSAQRPHSIVRSSRPTMAGASPSFTLRPWCLRRSFFVPLLRLQAILHRRN